MNKFKYDGYYITASSKEEAIKKASKIKIYEAYGMSTLYPDETGLDVPVWVDEDMTYKKGGHFKRIKFKAGVNQKNTYKYSTMKIDNQEIVESTLPRKKTDRYSHTVYEGVKSWVENNKFALEKLSDKLISLSQFKKAMIKGTKKANTMDIRKRILLVSKMMKELKELNSKKIPMEVEE